MARAATTGAGGTVPCSAVACQAICSGRLRRKFSSGMRANIAATSASPCPAASSSARAASRCSAIRSAAATGWPSPRRSARRVAVCRSANSWSFQLFHSFGEVPAMSAQVSR